MLKKLIPIGAIKYYKMLRARFKFKNCRIDSAYVSRKADLEDHVVIAENSVIESTVSIGRYSYMQPNCNINNCQMGRFCSLGNNVLINPWQHPMNRLSTNPKIYRNILGGGGNAFDDLPPRTLIGNDVWIGSNAIIMGGIHIGNGAVIGAGAVVTKDIPDYVIAVGNPARVIRNRFTSEEIQNLPMKWWDWSDEQMRANRERFL